MKKIIITLVTSVLCIIGAKAQETTTQVATLSHNGVLTPFYGKTSLKKAYEAAQNGDIITLSAGTFPMNYSIAKNITIRGVGGWADGNTDNGVTIIQRDDSSTTGPFSVTLQDSEHELTLEGVCFANYVSISSNFYKECTFSKVNFENHSFVTSSNVYAKLIHCLTRNYVELYQGICTNCVFYDINVKSGTNAITMQNCVISGYGHNSNIYSRDRGYFNEDVLINCIFSNNGSSQLAANNSVHNCVFLNTNPKDYDFFANVTNSTNKIVEDRENFFKNPNVLTTKKDNYGEISGYTLYFEDLFMDGTGLFELSDEAKKIYLGNDGTVVGVWGGATPFSMTPSNPRVKKFDVVPKVDDSGKLNVTIQVEQ